MGYETITGLVAREVNTGEADRFLTLLSAERGKVSCYARGIRSAKSKLAASAGLLTFGEFKMYEKSGRRILTSASSIETFYGIRTDVEKCAYAMHFLELARDIIVEEQPFPEALRTLLNTLFVLTNRDDMSAELISRVYEMRILAISGFSPELDSCTVCGASVGRVADFAPFGDGVICSGGACSGGACSGGACAGGEHGIACSDGEHGMACSDGECGGGVIVRLSAGTLSAMRYITSCDAKRLFGFSASPDVTRELSLTVPNYLRSHLGKEYEKLAEAERYRVFEREATSREAASREATYLK